MLAVNNTRERTAELTMAGALYSLILALCVFTTRASGCVEFMSTPESVTVDVGQSVSFSCVLTSLQLNISQWYINNKTARAELNGHNYVMWGGCHSSGCGGTLFITNITKDMNESVVCCQVLHDTCNGRNVTLSKSATIIVKSPSIEESSLLSKPNHTISTSSPSPPPTASAPQPSVFIDRPLRTDTETDPVMDKLVQRLPLLAVAAGICFILGIVFGAVCAVTVARGVQQRKRHKRRRRIAMQVRPDPDTTELTAQTNTSATTSTNITSSTNITPSINSSSISSIRGSCSNTGDSGTGNGRSSNDYMELGVTGSAPPRSSTPSEPAAECGRDCGGAAILQTSAALHEDGSLQSSRKTCAGHSESGAAVECSCIDIDLDELERAISQQD